MSSFLTTNLGEQAQTTRLVAQAVSALNYQQPFLQLGTLDVPLPTAVITQITFVPGYNKYVLYIATAATTAAINHQFQVLTAAVNLIGTQTVTGSADWIITGPTPTVTVFPLVTSGMNIINDTLAPGLGSNLTLFTFSPLGATYSSGTAILKMVININLD